MGTVYWITGLSGSGKTTVGQKLYAELKSAGRSIILFDGDVLRVVFNADGFERDQRLKLSICYSKLCQLIANQGIDVIIATISMFHQIHIWNRNNIKNYQEIYLKVPLSILETRDSKSIYSQAKQNDLPNVVGFDQYFEEPLCPDLIIENYGNMFPEKAVSQILALNLKAKKN